MRQLHRGFREWTGAANVSRTRTEACYLTTALNYIQCRPNQIKVMYGNNAMDFPSTSGLSFSPDDPKMGTYSGSNSERLVDLSARHEKGHIYSEGAWN